MSLPRSLLRCLPVLLVCLLCPATALAHAEQGVVGGLVSGLLHPILGFDHLVAMVAVGLWGAQLKSPAIWLLPITFPVVMALGAVLGVASVALPLVEFGIAASALVLGCMVTSSARPPLWVAAAMVSVFAIFHGHAHGTELPEAANALAYGVGFVISTGLLHLAGILLGVLVRWPTGEKLVRVCGLGVALVGAFVLATSLGFLT
jgi:urease accessory protein